jgi:hypothetical protein
VVVLIDGIYFTAIIGHHENDAALAAALPKNKFVAQSYH